MCQMRLSPFNLTGFSLIQTIIRTLCPSASLSSVAVLQLLLVGREAELSLQETREISHHAFE